MNIKIKYVKDAGNIKKERLVLEVTDNDNVGNYIIADSTYLGDGSVSNKLRHTFWVPDKDVSYGDLVIIYTKSGSNKTKENKDETASHFFYWGLESPIWNKNGDSALLIEVKNWASKNVVEN